MAEIAREIRFLISPHRNWQLGESYGVLALLLLGLNFVWTEGDDSAFLGLSLAIPVLLSLTALLNFSVFASAQKSGPSDDFSTQQKRAFMQRLVNRGLTQSFTLAVTLILLVFAPSTLLLSFLTKRSLDPLELMAFFTLSLLCLIIVWPSFLAQRQLESLTDLLRLKWSNEWAEALNLAQPAIKHLNSSHILLLSQFGALAMTLALSLSPGRSFLIPRPIQDLSLGVGLLLVLSICLWNNHRLSAKMHHFTHRAIVSLILNIPLRKSLEHPKKLQLPLDIKTQYSLIEDFLISLNKMSSSLFGAAERARFWTLGEMAALIAHDLSSPLHAIRYSSSQLESLIPKKPERVYIDQISNNTDRAIELLEALRARMRSTSGSSTTKSRFGESHNYVLRILKISTPAADFNKVRVETDPELHPLSFAIPQVELIHILENLYRNAFTAMSYSKVGRLQIRLVDQARGKATIEIADTGAGMCPEDFRNLTQFKCLVSPKLRYKGLGLKLTYQMVEYYGGQLECLEPEAGCQGARFHLTLPIEE